MTEPKPKPNPVASGAVVSPPKTFTHFGLLDHTLGNLDPGFWTATGVKKDAGLQARLEAMLAANPAWANLRVAIADLNGGAPKFAGNAGKPSKGLRGEVISPVERCLETWETASTSKIAILYAAYQLRRDVLAMAATDPAMTPEVLRDKMRLLWLKSQVIDTTLPIEELRAAGPKVELRGREVRVDGKRIPLVAKNGTKLGPPKLDEIFDISKSGATWKVVFKGEPEKWDTDPIVNARLMANLEPAGHAFASPLPPKTAIDKKPFTFFDKLWLMIDASHNEATDACLDAIGYLYSNSLLWQSGLFSPERGGGMWVGRHYAGSHRGLAWSPPPGPRLKTRDGDEIQAACSAAAGVALMTLLHQGKLVDADASRRMKIFCDRAERSPKGESVDYSPAAYGIARIVVTGGVEEQVLDREEVYSKIGLGSFNNYFDVALISYRNRKRGKSFRYAVSFMDYGAPRGWRDAGVLARALYDCIDPP